jgi:hypothetical protein
MMLEEELEHCSSRRLVQKGNILPELLEEAAWRLP